MRPSVAAVIGLSGLLLAGCAGANPGPPEPVRPVVAPPEAASASPSERTASPSPSDLVATRVGECFAYTTVEHYVLASDEPYVSCLGPHTAQTVYVGALTNNDVMSFADAQSLLTAINGPGGVGSLPDDVQARYGTFVAAILSTSTQCKAVIDEATGTVLDDGTRQASRFLADLTGPTPEQWAAGDRWIRCNVVAVLPSDATRQRGTLMDLPPSLNAALDDPTFRVCWIGSPAGRQVACSEPASPRVQLTLTESVPSDGACRALAEQFGAAADTPFQVTAGPDSRLNCAMPLSNFKSR